MTAKPVRAMTFEELQAEVVARPLNEDAQQSGDERLEEVRQEIARRDGAPVPLASAGLDDAPADPEQPSNPPELSRRPPPQQAGPRPHGPREGRHTCSAVNGPGAGWVRADHERGDPHDADESR